MTTNSLGLVSVVVADYDAAIDFYVNKVGFHLVCDERQSATKRWVVVNPTSATATAGGLLLAQAVGAPQEAAVGNQSGGRVWLFLNTTNFHEQYERMKANGVTFCEEPRHEEYGWVVVWKDLYGNKWDLLEKK
ncbi:Glyoxalase/bleomycin resistance protein/dioxygenase [Achlya hypogyna]|uniref:Glyoxalase/bleomycin resistance protein/dioxygenase n=1 Tax=Achlya hypogyna TaxID=1202772 RepID=A0A1V9YBH2_ACHHY|nr:Glyoxalase/bleomycin resistance protein/dioxygenase [Achlya hypogyna]